MEKVKRNPKKYVTLLFEDASLNYDLSVNINLSDKDIKEFFVGQRNPKNQIYKCQAVRIK